MRTVNKRNQNQQVSEMKTCYMCSRRATSREHVPPQCLFPESKDVSTGIDYRKNLITVPSCDQHNTGKSKEDQFLLFIALLHYGINPVVQELFSRKFDRTLEVSPGLTANLREPRKVTIDGSETAAFHIDHVRLHSIMENMVRALHYDEYREKWHEQMMIIIPSMFDDTSHNAPVINYRRQRTALELDRYLSSYPLKGANPEIFQYQIARDVESTTFQVKMVFYEGFSVYSYSSPNIASWK